MPRPQAGSPVLHRTPAVGFDRPFELLSACHERMQRTLDLLQRLGAHLATQGPDPQAASAAADVLRYFDIAGPAHHEDEERHILPALRARGEEALADRLAAEHRDMTQQWAHLRRDLAAIAEQRQPPDLAAACEAWRGFAATYLAHIALEEGRAYPAAQASVDPTTLAAMGAEMAARRRR